MGPKVGTQTSTLLHFSCVVLCWSASVDARLLKRQRMPPPRRMGRPVYEQEELTNFSTSLAFSAGLALGPPSSPAQDQALQLGTNGDILVGRADNGAIP